MNLLAALLAVERAAGPAIAARCCRSTAKLDRGTWTFLERGSADVLAEVSGDNVLVHAHAPLLKLSVIVELTVICGHCNRRAAAHHSVRVGHRLKCPHCKRESYVGHLGG